MEKGDRGGGGESNTHSDALYSEKRCFDFFFFFFF